MGLLRVALLISADLSPFPDNTSLSLFKKELEKKEVQITFYSLDSLGGRESDDAVCVDLYNVAMLFEHADEYDIIHSFALAVPLAFSKLVTTPLVVTLDWNAVKKDMQLYRKYNTGSYYVSDTVAGQSEELIYFDTVYTCAALDNPRIYSSPGGYCLIFCSHKAEIEKALEITASSGQELTAVIPAGSTLDNDPSVLEMVDQKGLTLFKEGKDMDCTDLLGNAGAILHFSSGKKAFDAYLIQGQSLGTPVIAFRDRVIEELVINGVNGFLVDSTEEAARAVKQLKDFDREACKASYLQRFSPSATAAGYRRVYERVYEIEKQDSKRPWGFFSVLYFRPPGCKVKEFVVLPGKRLSLQKHTYRAEYWQIAQGTGFVTLDGEELELTTGQHVSIPKGAVHRVENRGNENLVILEVQQGEYVGEDDIIRLQDDFGRSGSQKKSTGPAIPN